MGDIPRENLPTNKTSTGHGGNVRPDPIGAGIDAGSIHAINALDMIEKDRGSAVAEGYAAGMTAGLREWLIARYGHRDAYAFFQRLADDLAETMITVRQ